MVILEPQVNSGADTANSAPGQASTPETTLWPNTNHPLEIWGGGQQTPDIGTCTGLSVVHDGLGNIQHRFFLGKGLKPHFLVEAEGTRVVQSASL